MTSTVASQRRSMSVPVLMYHSISDDSSRQFRPYAVSPGLFAQHMERIRSEGFASLSMGELASLRRSNSPLPERAVAVTFDDGYRDFLTSALPVLATNSIRSTLYVSTGFVGGTSRWLVAELEDKRPMLSWSELREVANEGVECGGHTHSHPQLDLLSRRDAAREICLPKVLLEDHLQREVTSFAYPFGYANRAVRDMVAQFGYTNACTVSELVCDETDDAFSMPRLTVTPDVTTDALAKFLTSVSTTRDRKRAFMRGRASYALRRTRLKKRHNT